MTHQNQTDSLNLAAYLALLGFNCVSIKPAEDNSKFYFVFDMSEEDFKSHSDFFWTRSTNVDAWTYAEALKGIKSRMYHYKNQERQHERQSSF